MTWPDLVLAAVCGVFGNPLTWWLLVEWAMLNERMGR